MATVMAGLDVIRLARQVTLNMVTPEGEEVTLQRRPIPQLKTLKQSVFVFTQPMTNNPEAFAVITHYDNNYGLEVSKCGANELHILFRDTELGVIPRAEAPGVAPGYFSIPALPV